MKHQRGSLVFQAIIGLFLIGAIAAFSMNAYKRARLAEQQSKYSETARIIHNASIILSKESSDEDGDSVQEAPMWDSVAGEYRIPSTSKAPRKDAWGNDLIYCPFDYGDAGVSTYSYVHVVPSGASKGGIRIKVPSSKKTDLASAPAFALYSLGPFAKPSLISSLSTSNPEGANAFWGSPCINETISNNYVAGSTATVTRVMTPTISFEWGPKSIVSYSGMEAFMPAVSGGGGSTGNKYYAALPDPSTFQEGEMILVGTGSVATVYVKSGGSFKHQVIRGTSFDDVSKLNYAQDQFLIIDGNDNNVYQNGADPDYLYGGRYAGIFVAQSKSVGSLFVNIANSDCQIPDENTGYTDVDATFMCGFTIGRIKEGPTASRPNVQNNLNNMSPTKNPDLVTLGYSGLIFGSGENSMRFIPTITSHSSHRLYGLSRFEIYKKDLNNNIRTYYMNSRSDNPIRIDEPHMNLPALSVNSFKVFDQYGILNLPTITTITNGGTCPDKDRGGMAIDSNGDVYVCQ